ncbi:hypothetical protein LTSERUB_3275 [Salmonella enterica subsp. enterica serovar Rubislaw str. A4-653]|uniref:Uncharacterized protein n=1 Tax=Salmonella enterica subsp. enterica serovar Rubislaw str. A4-653 TaxID=913081 RepID=G5QKQ7_SALRU|nr:hypothetical protein LTSERUB_3275 [Salmonella enterica subsp. enterica serovar Rubislaw str. A4-653]
MSLSAFNINIASLTQNGYVKRISGLLAIDSVFVYYHHCLPNHIKLSL